MAKDIVIIPADGQIVFSGSSTHHNILTVDSQSISITTDNFIIDGGSITAQNYVVSSSVTHMTQSFSSGSTIFGDSADDSHQFTGNITASGNISASGDGFFAGINVDNGSSGDPTINFIKSTNPSGIRYDGTSFVFQRESTGTAVSLGVGNITFGGGGNSKISAVTNTSVTVRGGTTDTVFNTTGITTEGNISGSGTGSFDGGLILGERILMSSDTGGNQKIMFGDSTQNIQGTSDYIVIESDNQAVIKADNKVNIDSPVMGVGAFTTGDTAGAVLHISGVNATNESLIVEGSDGTDYLTVGLGGHITASGNLLLQGGITASTDIHIGGSIIHDGDPNTKLDFSGDQLIFNIGGETLLTLTENGSQDIVTIGDGGDVDFKVRTLGDDNTIFAQGSSDNVGVGTDTPGEKLEVIGNITASGNISADGSITASKMTIEGNYPILTFKDLDGGANKAQISAQGYTLRVYNAQNHSSADTYMGTYGNPYAVYVDQSAGKSVGISTHTPTATSRLDVSGSFTTTGPEGHITASGNISASGTIFASAFSSPNGDGDIDFSDSLDISGNITASGHISASGTGNHHFGGTLRPDKIIVDDITINGSTISDTQDLTINPARDLYIDVTENGEIYFQHDGGETIFQFNLDSTPELDVTGNFTIDGTGDIELNADGGNISFKDNTTTLGGVNNSGIFSSNHITASGNISASGNFETNGYIDISGASSDPGVDGVVRLGQSSNALRVYTNDGYIQIGPTNSGWAHFYTDRSNFYFNQPLVVDDGIVSSYDEDLILRRDYNDTTYNQITIGDDTYELKLDNTVRHSIDGVGNNIFTGNITASGVIKGDGGISSSNATFTGDIDVDGTTNLDVVDIDGAVDMASTLTIAGVTTLGSATSNVHQITGSIEATGSGNLIKYRVADTVSSVDGSTKTNAFKVHSHNASTSNSKLSFQLNDFTFLSVSSTNGAAFSSLYIGEDLTSAGGYESIVLPAIARLTWGDSLNTHIEVNSESPEDLLISADEDLFLKPDDNLFIQAGSTTYATFFGTEKKLRLNSTSTSAPLSVLDVSGDITATHITASGNISASGTIFASKFESTGTSNETIAFNDNLNITGHITASGNISSSGKGIFDTIDVKSSITGSYPKLTDSGGNTIYKISGVVGSNTEKIQMGDVDNQSTGEQLILDCNNENPIFYSDPNASVKWGINNNPQNSIDGLTVHGGISASGNFFGNFPDTNDNATHYPLVTDGTKIERVNDMNFNPSTGIVSFGNQISVNSNVFLSGVGGHITASGDISSSGTITAEHIVSSDDMNVSDRLTVTGDIYAQSDIFVADTVTHNGDTNTKMTFGSDSITFTAGGIEMLKLVEGVADAVTINEGSTDVNLRVESNNNQYMLFVDGGADKVGIGKSAPTKTLEVAGEISSSNAISVANTEVISGSGEILNRFQLVFDYQGRLSAADKWYSKSARGGFGQLSTQLAAGSDPDGTAVTYLAAARYSSYTAPRACKLIRGLVTILNYTNDDDVRFGIYKGTAVNDSNSNITINKIGSDFAPTMDEDKTYFVSQDFSSGNTLAANDFLIFTIHTTSHSGTSYPQVNVNLELQYT